MKFLDKIFGTTPPNESQNASRGREIAEKENLMARLTQVNAWLTRGVGLTEERRKELAIEKESLEKDLGIRTASPQEPMSAPAVDLIPEFHPREREALTPTTEDPLEVVAVDSNLADNFASEARSTSNEAPVLTSPDQKQPTIIAEQKEVSQQPQTTLHYTMGGREQTFVVGAENQVPNLNETHSEGTAQPQQLESAAINSGGTSLPLEGEVSADTVPGVPRQTVTTSVNTTSEQKTPGSQTENNAPKFGETISTDFYLDGGVRSEVQNTLNSFTTFEEAREWGEKFADPFKNFLTDKEFNLYMDRRKTLRDEHYASNAPVANAQPTLQTPSTPRVEWHNNQNEHQGEELLSQEKINGYISRAAAKGYPENIFSGCATESEIVKAMGSFMKEKYYDLGYPHDLFTSCETPIEVKNTAIAYRENLIHERALEEQDRLARVAGIRPNSGEAGRIAPTQEARREVVTPEALAVSERINAVREAQEERVSSRRIPGGWWSRNKEKVTGTAGILGGALGIAALAFCLFGKTCTVPATNEATPVAAPIAAAVQNCEKQKEIKVVKKKIAAATKKAAPEPSVAKVSVRETTSSVVTQAPAPQVTAVASLPVVTAVPSTPTVNTGFREVLPSSVAVTHGGGAPQQVVYQTTVWNPGSSSYYNGGSTTYVYGGGTSGGGSTGLAPKPGTAPVGGTTPVQPPQVKPPVPGPVTGGTGGVQVPPPVGGPSVGGPSIGAPISGGVSGPRPNTSAPTVNAPIIGGGYSGGVPNIGGPSGGSSFGNNGAPIVRPPTINAPISNGSYSNNSSYSSGGSFVGGPSFGGSNGSGGAPIVGAPNLGRPVSGGAPVINTQTGGSSSPSVSGPKFGTR